jgi:hypothetical protein
MVPIVPEPLPDLSGVPVQLVHLLRKAGAKGSESLENAGHGSTEATV